MKYISLVFFVLLLVITAQLRAQEIEKPDSLALKDSLKDLQNFYKEKASEMPIYNPCWPEAKILIAKVKDNIDNMPIAGERDTFTCGEDSLYVRKYLPE